MSISAMKQALDALDSDDPSIQLRAAVALRQAIAEAEKPKMRRATREEKIVNPGVYEVPMHSLPLMQEGKDFTVSKPWVWLTYEEIDEIYEEYGQCRKYGYEEAIQEKLKEKNT